MPFRTDEGQALPLMLLALLFAGGLLIALSRLGGLAVDDARARTAADAAALAGAAEGEAAARDVAARNNGDLVLFEPGVRGVRVTVVVAGRRAVAEAERAGPPPGGAGAGTTGLTAEMVAAVQRAEALLGRPIPITSGWRSPAQQAWLWAHRDTNPFPVARPGTSMHERGLAIDVALPFVPELRTVAAQAGLCFPLPETDPIHFELCPPPPR